MSLRLQRLLLHLHKSSSVPRPNCGPHSIHLKMATRFNHDDTSKLNVKHDEKDMEFFIELTNNDVTSRAFLQYEYITPKYVDLQHTVVPEEFRGHGVAKVLAKTAFDHFVDRKVDMRLTCTYLVKYYNDNPLPQYTERVK